MKNALIIMAKQPAPGQTKTRLTPPLSPEQASQLYECFLYDMLEIGQATAHSIPNLNYFIAYAPATATSYFTQLAPNFGLIAQRGENLGQRLDSVISEQFQAGFDAVVAINSDSPTLPSHLVVEAFSQLHSGEVEAVFGPCEDGGYYLIGLCAPQPRLVRDVQMSTSHVLADTLMIAEELGLRVHLLPSWYDVDTKDELTKLQREIQSGASDVAIHTRRFFLNSDLMKSIVVIPALNEAENIEDLVRQAQKQPVDRVVVVDNGSTDKTAELALEAGADVVSEPRRGYGYACAAGVSNDAEIVVFLDGDFSSHPDEMEKLLRPIVEGKADLVLGSRMRGHMAEGSMPAHQRFGNWLVSGMMRTLYGIKVTDLGPYRAIRRDLLQQLDMREMTFGWPTEMMVKAARHKARMIEVPVDHYPRRAGQSKVSGTIRGSILAAYYILGVTLRYAF